jgi:signal transduction histidine kinase
MNPGFLGSMNSVAPDKAKDAIRVLLVDDDEDYYVLTRAAFSDIEDQSYDLDWKISYDDALTAMQRTRYDVCLLDYHLGGRDGLDLLQTARQSGYPAPMIMLTGHGDRQIDLEAMAAGAADYLYKARTDSALLERSIRYAIDRTRLIDTLRENEARIAALYHQEQEHSRELERAYADLRRAENMRDDLAHMIIHDLRGPLAAIMANIQLVGRAFDNSLPASQASSYLAGARTSANRMMWMIDDLLNVSKLEAGELRLMLKPIYLPAFLAEKQETYLAQLAEDGKTLDIHSPADLPTIMADIELLGRVFDNLIGNALKYTQAGGHINITAEAHDQTLTIRVSDDGDGLLPEDQTRIFEKFAQGATANTQPSRHGTGLGLAFCRLVILAHGGTIMASGEPGHGATFTITLPISHQFQD